MCQGLLPSRRHIEKREDPGDEVGSRHFSFFSRAKIGATSFSPFPSPVTHFFALAPIFARLKNEKCLERAEYLTETFATQARAAWSF